MKSKLQKILKPLGWYVGLFIIIALLGFVEKSNNEQLCQSIKIDFDSLQTEMFIDQNDVLTMVKDKEGLLKDNYLKAINIPGIEDFLHQNAFIEKAKVYTTLQGDLHINIRQRKPVVRIFNLQNDSYYIDQFGYLMPTSDKYASHILVANGHITEPYGKYENVNLPDSLALTTNLDDIYRVSHYINSDAFLKAQFQQIYIKQNNDIELIPIVGNHIVLLGKADEEMPKRFEKLKIFYKEALNKVGWTKYKYINLKYNNQVVCTKIDEHDE